VYPTEENIFAALNLCPLGKVKVVILGQDPYHGPDQAHGLAFSVPDDIAIPPSLQNIYKEIATDIGIPIPLSGNLTKWAEQGVLLLNSTLTVAAGKPLSHAKYGWEQFTDAVITLVSEKHDNVVFLLWGSFAVSKRPLIDEGKHLVLTAPHPSPLSAYRGFFGCRHFSQCNDYLLAHHKQPIRW
jgi:uracil-DNA glycosylase